MFLRRIEKATAKKVPFLWLRQKNTSAVAVFDCFFFFFDGDDRSGFEFLEPKFNVEFQCAFCSVGVRVAHYDELSLLWVSNS